MPYLTFSEANVRGGKSAKRRDTLVTEYGIKTIHELRTLDRYYYSSLPEKDIEKRNTDQVLTKYIKSKKKDKKFGEPSPALAVDQQHEKRGHCKGTKPKDPQHKDQHKGPKKNDTIPEKDEHKGPKKTDTEPEEDKGLILQVDQLWLWVIDSGKTAFS